MAEIKLTIPAGKLNRVVHALCVREGLEETPANAKQVLIQFIKREVWRVETREAEAAVAVPEDDALVS